MTDKPTTRPTVAAGRALYRVSNVHAVSTTVDITDTAPTLEQLLADPVLLGRTRARANNGDRTARAAVAAHDGAWRALNEAGGDDNDAA